MTTTIQPNIYDAKLSNRILVTASTAPVGRSIIEQLAAAGHSVRALTRDPHKANFPAGAEVVAGDLGNYDSLKNAMKDVTAVFLLAVVPGFMPGFLQAAKENGVRRIVFQSSGAIEESAVTQPNQVAAFHYAIEQELKGSGLEWTFLRLNVSSSDAIQWAFDLPGQLKKGDSIRGPYADAANSPIHPTDFATLAIAALTRAELANRILDVTGPQSITHRQEVALIGQALGRNLVYEELDLAAARAEISPYAPAELLFETWQKYTTMPAPVNDTFQRLTGLTPRSVEEWAADYATGMA